MTGNTFYGSAKLVELQLASASDNSTYLWNNNAYFADGPATTFTFGALGLDFAGWQRGTGLDQNSQYVPRRPTGAKIVVRPNQYEPGRGNIIVYNWDKQVLVDVDISQVLTRGAKYEIRNAQDYFGAPIAGGIYDGTPIRLPMAGAEFNVFVLIRISP
jgi:hypothetical protein